MNERLPVRSRWTRSAAVLLLTGLAQCAPEELAYETDDDVNPSRVEAVSVRMPACGTVLASFDGTEAYSNGANTGTGRSCAGYGRYGLQYQCVELVMRHFTTHWGLRWNGNAKYLLDNAPRSSVDVYSNGDGAHPPVPGDMVVWTPGTYGHVALVTEVTATSVKLIEQNSVGSGTITLAWDGSHLGPRWGSWIPAGWAHARANRGPRTPAPSPDAGTPPAPSPDAGAPSPDAGAPPVEPDASAPPAPAPEACGRYEGYDVRTCAGSAEMIRCVGGALQRTACAPGGRCLSRPDGYDDVCLPAPGTGEACGANSWVSVFTCNRDRTQRVLCANGTLLRESCPRGCLTRPSGQDDVCAP
jgi:hypothetical protein